MSLWLPDICDCEIATNPQGDPAIFVRRCAVHTTATPQEVLAESAAKERAREAVRVEMGWNTAPDWQRSRDGGHEIILPDGVSKAKRDRVAARVAEVGHPTRTKLTTLAEIRAKVAAKVR